MNPALLNQLEEYKKRQQKKYDEKEDEYNGEHSQDKPRPE